MPIGNPTLIGSGDTTFAAVSTITTTASVTAGNCLAVISAVSDVISSGQNAQITSVTDGTNNYTQGFQFSSSDAPNDRYITFEVWVCTNAQAVASGASLVVTYGNGVQSATRIMSVAVQISGLALSAVVDTSACVGARALNATGLGSGITTGSLAQASEIILSGTFTFPQATVTEDANFTTITTILNGSDTLNAAYEIVSSNAAVTYNPTVSFINTVVEIAVPLKAPSAQNPFISNTFDNTFNPENPVGFVASPNQAIKTNPFAIVQSPLIMM